MAVQLSHPESSQGVYVCGFCSFTSPDHRILVKHLVDHSIFKEKKHEHILWCGLCRPLTDVNYVNGQQQTMTDDHLIGSAYRDDKDLGYGDASNYYSGYNGLYNPYTFPNAYYYPMNVAYRNPCYGNVDGYYQPHDAVYYTDDFYNGTDIHSCLNTPPFIEPAAENKYLSDASRNSKSKQGGDSILTISDTLPDFEIHPNDYNSVNYESNVATLSFDSVKFPENSLGLEESGKSGTFTKSITNDELNVVQTNECGTTLNIEPQPDIIKSSIQFSSDKTISGKLNDSQEKKLSSEIPEPNAVKQSSFQRNAHKINSESVPNFTDSSSFEFFSETGCIEPSVVDAKSATKTNSIIMKANTGSKSGSNKKSCSKLPPVELAEPSENVHANTSSTEENIPVSFPGVAYLEKIVINDGSDGQSCSIDIHSKIALRKESNSQRCTCELESSDNSRGERSIFAQDTNVVPVLDGESSSEVNTAVLTKNNSDTEDGSINQKSPLAKIDRNDIHSECPTGELMKLSKIQNSISKLSGNDSVSTVELSPKMNVIVGGNMVSDIEIQSISAKDLREKKDKALGIGKRKVLSFEKDIGQVKKDMLQLKKETRENTLNRNSHRESKADSKTESSKKCLSDKTNALSGVENNLSSSCRNDLNYAIKSCRSVPPQQVRLTYSEVVKRGLPIKSSG